MQKCPVCGRENRPGVIFCEKCGANLRSGAKPQETNSLGQGQQRDIESQLDQPISTPATTTVRGTDVFPKGGALRLEIEGSPEPIHLTFRNREVVLGRRDPATGALPDVDMTPFAGYRMGVSRRHSQIRYSEDGHLDVFDLGSSNGTFLNGERLEAHYPYRLHDGDRVGLGQIVIRIFFEGGSKTKQPEAATQKADEKAAETATASEEKKPVSAASEAPDKPDQKSASASSDAQQQPDAEKKTEVSSVAGSTTTEKKAEVSGTTEETTTVEKKKEVDDAAKSEEKADDKTKPPSTSPDAAKSEKKTTEPEVTKPEDKKADAPSETKSTVSVEEKKPNDKKKPEEK